MSPFQPTRASSPLIRSSVLSNSTRTAAVAPELQNLSVEDVGIIDAVIQRAGPNATTFFNIFKAYSDVLSERGLDPQEVVYYGKLLKLGTLKGKNWGEKWESVKTRAEHPPVSPTLENFSLASDIHHVNQPVESPGSQYSYLTIPKRDRIKKLPVPSLDPSSKLRKITTPHAFQGTQLTREKLEMDVNEAMASRIHPGTIKPSHYHSSTVTSDDGDGESSPIPPSYKSAHLEAARPYRIQVSQPLINRSATPVSTEAKKTKDLDAAWKSIKMEQDEKFADNFREEVLIARCWEIWRQGFLWIVTTHQQIGEARDKLLLELFMQRWLRKIASRRAQEDTLIRQLQKHSISRFFGRWQSRLKRKRQEAWRNDMRQKMKIIRSKSDIRIKQDAWAKWRQLQRSHQAESHYQVTLLSRCLFRWKARIEQLDDLDAVADKFSRNVRVRSLKNFWDLWRHVTSLRHNEDIMTRKFDYRVMSTTFDVWRTRNSQVKAAVQYNQRLSLKHTILKWKQARSALRGQERRAERHIARQDEVLLRAVVRIWRARMRGKRMEQFRWTLIQREAWHKWKASMARRKSQSDDAAAFFDRSNLRLVSGTLRRWREVLATHQNAHTYAVTFDAARLRSKMIILWRFRLRETLQNAKIARWANKFFATRRAWQTWVAAMEERKRQKKLELWNLARTQKLFNGWRLRVHQVQYSKQCEHMVQLRVERRILASTLVHWTNRVIELKSRELDVAHQQNLSLQRSAFQKWRSCRLRHVEEVSLLENYLLVKQEDILRRAFHRWLAAKRSAAHRRLTHQRKEAQLRQMTITTAWERWREKFKEERLRPLEYQIIFQSQKNIMSHAFRIWFSKTESLPAVKFHSMHLKEKFFKRWQSVIPNALRAKKARETDKYNTLAKYFEKWANAYKTKITLKAVARAKYLRLPPAPCRKPASHPIYTDARRSSDTDSEAGDTSILEPLREAFIPRSRTVKSPGARSERSIPRSENQSPVVRQRGTSPARSVASMPDRGPRSPRSVGSFDLPARNVINGGGRLWAALRDIEPQRRRRNL